ncbi:PP2C family protein-serine/threonine phosphatase [Kitasatospora albolonga]|uniref:PP2C family protein-serine/threonine phosphatase n=1 Tax=Kitasatospora albolonga TaxID=68173 RepID=UPI0031EF91F1
MSGRWQSALARFLERSHALAPQDVAALVEETARHLGLDSATVLLADVQQERLVPLPGRSAVVNPEEQEIDGSVAGRAYRTVTPQVSPHAPGVAHVPLLDGITRLGVLRVTADRLTPEPLEAATRLAAVVAVVVVSKSAFSDEYARTVRTRRMTTAAEMVWAFLPPQTIGTEQVTSTAVVEPAYEVGGDAFDHGLDDGHLHLTVVDAMGHDLAAGLSSAVALAGGRATRRTAGTLTDITDRIDADLDQWLPGRLLTGIFARLDLTSGQLSWINAGHPPPLLIRANHVVADALAPPGELPLGLGPGYRATRTVHQAQLEPGDRILIHTDGVTEARSRTGERYGEQQLTDLVTRSLAADEPAPEALRRLIRAVLDHHLDPLDDDATILLAEWHPTRAVPCENGLRPA